MARFNIDNVNDMEEKVKYERNGRHILWTVPSKLMAGKTAEDIMTENGYHPAAYGSAYDYKDNGSTITFKCSSSSD